MKTMFLILGGMLLLAAAAYFIENAFEKRKWQKTTAKAASRLTEEQYRLAEMDKLNAMLSEGIITHDEFTQKCNELKRQ